MEVYVVTVEQHFAGHFAVEGVFSSYDAIPANIREEIELAERSERYFTSYHYEKFTVDEAR